MFSNLTLEEVKKEIKKEFDSRNNDSARGKINFNTENQDVLEGIAKTYIYYARNFPETIDPTKIEGVDRVSRILNKPLPTTMADLYLDRLLLNMLEIGKTTDAKGLVENNGIFFNRDSMGRQLSYWKKEVYFGQKVDLLKGNEDVVSNNLVNKVVIHELSHMSAIPEVSSNAGFYNGSNMRGKETYASRFEEICAEATALSITGQKIPSHKSIVSGDIKVQIGGYNPESSNYEISSMIELAPFAFGRNNLEVGRLTDPVGYMSDLNNRFVSFGRDGCSFVGRIQEDLKAIVDKKEYARLPKLQTDFMKIGMRRVSNINYLNTCDEIQFKQDVGFMLRLEPLLYKRYVSGQLQQTENIVEYDSCMIALRKTFDLLKTQRKMFANYKTFDDFISDGKLAIENRQRMSLGLEMVSELPTTGNEKTKNDTALTNIVPHMGAKAAKSSSTIESVTDSMQSVVDDKGIDNVLDSGQSDNSSNTNNAYSYSTIDITKEKIGALTKSQHAENVEYIFIYESINNLINDCIKANNPENIEILNRAKRLWSVMAYDNGMRVTNTKGESKSVTSLLRKYYKDGFQYIDEIPNEILSNESIPSNIKLLFEDLYITRGLPGMADIMEVDFGCFATQSTSDKEICEAVQLSYMNNPVSSSETIDAYNSQFGRGDIEYVTRKYLQSSYNYYGGKANSNFEDNEYRNNSQQYLLKYLSQDLERSRQRIQEYSMN